MEARYERSAFYRFNHPVLRPHVGTYQYLRAADREQVMNILYLITGLITLGLFIYLVLALMKPEWFG
jgi:K+-transporting ATPase KdpF subunit